MIGAKIKTSSLPCPTRDGVEEVRFENPVFMVAGFRPGIGKKNPNFGERHVGGKRIEELAGLRTNEVAVEELGSVALSSAPLESIENHVHPDTALMRELGGIPDQKMTVTAADFPDKRLTFGQQRGQRLLEGIAAAGYIGQEFGLKGHGS
ncbi:MAG: hypothetical protein Q8J74_02925 [Candidatus Didemnitutus sp.]|nr:hypothetical protein [Candidatus Didemnitutus sp.]